VLNNINVQVTFYFVNLKEGQAARVIAIKNIVERLTGAIQTTRTRKLLEFLIMKFTGWNQWNGSAMPLFTLWPRAGWVIIFYSGNFDTRMFRCCKFTKLTIPCYWMV